jgi:hypothetical protein
MAIPLHFVSGEIIILSDQAACLDDVDGRSSRADRLEDVPDCVIEEWGCERGMGGAWA